MAVIVYLLRGSVAYACNLVNGYLKGALVAYRAAGVLNGNGLLTCRFGVEGNDANSLVAEVNVLYLAVVAGNLNSTLGLVKGVANEVLGLKVFCNNARGYGYGKGGAYLAVGYGYGLLTNGVAVIAGNLNTLSAEGDLSLFTASDKG